MEAIYDVNKGRRLKNYYYAAVTDGTCWGVVGYEMAKGEQVEEFRESESKRIANHESIIDELLK